MKIDIVGVYHVPNERSCHIVELLVRDYAGTLEMVDFTQEIEGQPRSNWQVPWDERVLSSDGEADLAGQFPKDIEVDGNSRIVFILHHTNFSRPLLTPAGALTLPTPQSRPARLEWYEYESPC